MFYKIEVKDHIRVPPSLFGLQKDLAIIKQIKKKFEGFVSKELGIVIDVAGVKETGEGIIVSGDGASFYNTTFEILTYKPEMHEVVVGKVKDIADFGVFMALGPIEGMIHVSQTIDDFVSFSKEKVLTGKETKRTLRVGDMCKAKIIAVSFKDQLNPKLGLTMRQKGLGKLEWIEEDLGTKKEKEEPAAKESKKKK